MPSQEARHSWVGKDANPWRRAICRILRGRQTAAEAVFWEQVRAGRCEGLKWRRQHPVGRYVVDFLCIELGLVVELDGASHSDRRDYDDARDAFLRSHGLTVVRLSNEVFLSDPAGFLARVVAEVRRRGTSPQW